MLDELLDMFGGGDDDDDRRRRRPDGSRRQGGIRGFISRLIGGDDDGEDVVDTRDARQRDRRFEDDGRYEDAGRRNRRERDRDDGGWFDLGD
jgi:hypothetical protein